MNKAAFLYFCLSAGVLGAPFLYHIQAAPGDLYASDQGSNVISRFTPAGIRTNFAQSGPNPPVAGLAFDKSGNLFAADQDTGSILKFTPQGFKTTFASGLNGPDGLAFDSSGNLFVTDSSGSISRFTSAGTKNTFASGLNFPASLAFDRMSNLFVANHGGGTIFKFTPTGTRSIFASGLSEPDGLAFDNSGNLFVTNTPPPNPPFLDGTIFKFTPTGVRSVFASGLNQPVGLAFDNLGNLFVTDFGTHSILKFTPTGIRSTFGSLYLPSSLAFEPITEKLRNTSVRGLVQTGDNVLITGFVLGGNGLANNAVLVRALGPSLRRFGINNPLQDPMIELHNSNGALIATNDNWQDNQRAEILAHGLAPSDAREPAIYTALPAGAFTAIVRGIRNTTGIALIEVFSVSN